MAHTFPLISTEQLVQNLEGKHYSLIDTRPVDAYNGWPMQGEARGGHIPGARSLPLKWTRYIDWIEIVRAKGIHPHQQVVLYGYEREEIRKVADRFRNAGYNSVFCYDRFLSEWSADPVKPMNKLKRYRQLVYPQWLNSLLQGNKPAEYNNNRFVLCHAHYQNPADYSKGHIPGAVALDTNSLESMETWNRRSPEELRNTLEACGITRETTVILYGRFSFPSKDDPFPGSSAGHLGSIRAAFIMMYAGVQDVRILNGGVQSWLDEGYSLTRKETKSRPVPGCGIDIPERPQLAVDVPEAKNILASEDAELVCVRSWPEYIGEVSGYHYIHKKGRIPGAVFGNCGSDAYHMENYRNLDHTTREFGEIEEEWKEVGVVPGKHNAFYCGTGWRGSEAWLNAWLMGWPRVSVFDGGWYEWSSNPGNPVETGLPKEK